MKTNLRTGRRAYTLAALSICIALVLAACGASESSNGESGGASTSPSLTAGAPVGEATIAPGVPTETAGTAPTAVTPAETAVGGGTPAGETPPAGAEPTTGVAEVPGDSVTAFPDPSAYAWNPVVSGLNLPLDLTSPPDGSGRLFILEQSGAIRIVQDGTLLPEPFLDVSDLIKRDGNEQGLLGIAFHPDFAQNGFFYINYTSTKGVGDTVVARYQVSAEDPNRADPGSQKVLLEVQQPYQNHNGGGLAFGPDGYLYISLGDGGSRGDPQGNGQSTEALLGKLLRIDVDGGDPYAIPADNPFASGGGRGEIWAYGLRNPWRFSFDRLTGDLWIADVGQNQWEEINFQAAGAPGGVNYGWDFREATHPYEGNPPADLVMVDPVFEYDHSSGCSVTGGYVYRGRALQEFRGIYLFADYCSGIVWGLLRDSGGAWQSQELFSSGKMVTSFGLDAAGEIYLIDQSSGSVFRLEK